MVILIALDKFGAPNSALRDKEGSSLSCIQKSYYLITRFSLRADQTKSVHSIIHLTLKWS